MPKSKTPGTSVNKKSPSAIGRGFSLMNRGSDLPNEQLLTEEVERTRRTLEARSGRTGKRSKR